MQQSTIERVTPKLEPIRYPKDMIYSNVILEYTGKSDTLFFQAKRGDNSSLYALQTTPQGYHLSKIKAEHHHYDALQPFMSDWPAAEYKSQYTFIIAMHQHAVLKHVSETVAQFLQRLAQEHYLFLGCKSIPRAMKA
ncbi:hypothetical protein ABK905_20130 [Acerihabitans sp. KWT182]|uniref:Uncharacterized protein n=1 Tax=Acerihabitans sp. KWT182 TaxID=3157919 RepID=A0AAU7Q720_9GAMM